MAEADGSSQEQEAEQFADMEWCYAPTEHVHLVLSFLQDLWLLLEPCVLPAPYKYQRR